MLNITCVRNTASGDVHTAAKVGVDKVPSVVIMGADGGGDSSDAAYGRQLPLVRESDMPGWLVVIDQFPNFFMYENHRYRKSC